MNRRVGRILRGIVIGVVALGLCELLLAGVAAYVARSRGESVAPEQRGGIFCVGDSNTFGIGAPEGKSYPDQLRALLAEAGDGRSVVNLGVPGFPIARMVGKLENALKTAAPSLVVFVGGANDYYRGDLLLEMRRVGSAARSRTSIESKSFFKPLRKLRTYRLLEAFALRVAGADPTERFGGALDNPWPNPEEIPRDRWDEVYAQAERGGTEPLFRWLAFYWLLEFPDETGRAFDRFVAQIGPEALANDLRYSFDCFRWDVDMLLGKVGGRSLDPKGRSYDETLYAEFTRGYAALVEGRREEAAALFDAVLEKTKDPWLRGYVWVHRAWLPLLARDFGRADEELSASADFLASLSPYVALYQGFGGAALAHVLRDDTTRLAEWIVGPREVWKAVRYWFASPDGHAYMLAAEWIDAIKGGDAKQREAIRGDAHARYGPTLPPGPLAFLEANPDATLAGIREGIPIGPPRASFFGPRRLFWRFLGGEEFEVLVQPPLARLSALAREHGFQVLVLTYLNYEADLPNDRLRRFAREEGWPLVDMEAVYGRTELGADGKTRYFSPDRAHPNEVGYGLTARAAFAKIREMSGRP